MKFNKYSSILIAVTATLLLWSCSDNDTPEYPAKVDRPEWAVSFSGDDEAPSWDAEIPAPGKYQFSMTAAIRLSDYLSRFAGADDRIAAFIGDECRGTVKPIVSDGQYMFLLHIRGNTAESERLSLRYYSARNRRIYTCRDLTDFYPNGTYGTVIDPVIPPFDDTSKYPESMTVTVCVSEHPTFTRSEGDMIAAFIDDECRATAEPEIAGDGTCTYTFEVRGCKNENGTVRFRYFSDQVSGIYDAYESLRFVKDGTEGTATEPFNLNLKPCL